MPSPGTSSVTSPDLVLALGRRKVGDTVRFAVPPHASSITVVEQTLSAPTTATFTDSNGALPNTAVPLTLTDSTGHLVFNAFDTPSDASQAELYFGSLSPGTGTVTLPNTSEGLRLVAQGLPSGTWSLVVSDLAHVCSLASNCASGGGSADSTYDLTVIIKEGTGTGTNIAAIGQLDVTFNLVPPLSAATAGKDDDVQRMVRSMGVLLGRAGLALGAVAFVDVPPAEASRVAGGVHLDDSTACGELAQLFATAPPGRQINVFLVPALLTSNSQGTTTVGFDGTIPGPATVSPTLQSGVAVSSADLRAGRSNCHGGPALDCGTGSSAITCCGADLTAYVASHEIGHYLGLYHVTERYGTDFDPLKDTPTCACSSCSPNPSMCQDAASPPESPHVMSIRECEASPKCAGGDNLMFWLIGDESVGSLTDEQQRVMRANPAVY